MLARALLMPIAGIMKKLVMRLPMENTEITTVPKLFTNPCKMRNPKLVMDCPKEAGILIRKILRIISLRGTKSAIRGMMIRDLVRIYHTDNNAATTREKRVP